MPELSELKYIGDYKRTRQLFYYDPQTKIFYCCRSHKPETLYEIRDATLIEWLAIITSSPQHEVRR